MVSILPNQRSPWDVIGSQIGQNLHQTLPGAVQQGYQRQTGLNAIDQLQKELGQAGGDINKMLPALARAISLNPALERSGLGQEFLKNQAAGMYPSALGGSSGSTPNPNIVSPIADETQQSQPPGLPADTSKGKTNIDSIANQYIAEVRPDLINPETQYGAINTFGSAIKQDLSPEEESQLRQQLMDKYKNPNIANQVLDRVREGVRNKYNEAQAKYGFDKERREQIQQKWRDFTAGSANRLEPHVSKYGEQPRTKEVLNNKYNQYAEKQPTNMTPENMHTNAMALLQNDINKIDALQALPSMPPFRNEQDAKDYIGKYKDTYKDLADQGFMEALREDAIMNKDMGNEEFHSMIWGDQTDKNTLNRLHSFEAPVEYQRGKIGTLNSNKYNPEYPKQHEKYISDISKTLKELKPKDDLMIARAMVLDQNGTVEDFTKALNEARKNGLELSEFQKSQLQEINIPRVPPLYEIFSERNFTKPALKAWAPWVNYMRGKK